MTPEKKAKLKDLLNTEQGNLFMEALREIARADETHVLYPTERMQAYVAGSARVYCEFLKIKTQNPQKKNERTDY